MTDQHNVVLIYCMKWNRNDAKFCDERLCSASLALTFSSYSCSKSTTNSCVDKGLNSDYVILTHEYTLIRTIPLDLRSSAASCLLFVDLAPSILPSTLIGVTVNVGGKHHLSSILPSPQPDSSITVFHCLDGLSVVQHTKCFPWRQKRDILVLSD